MKGLMNEWTRRRISGSVRSSSPSIRRSSNPLILPASFASEIFTEKSHSHTGPIADFKQSGASTPCIAQCG
jgi:hypothetical protein